MIKIGALKDKKVDILKTVTLKNQLASMGVEDCYKNCRDIEDSDWKTFYDVYVCLMEFKKSFADLRQVKEECKKDIDLTKLTGIQTISDLESMSEDDKKEIGCASKCTYEKLGSYRNGSYDSLKFVQSLPNAIRGLVAERMLKCEEETNAKFNEEERFSCRYYFDFDVCIEI